MTRRSESEGFTIKIDSFIELMSRLSLIDAKLPAIRDIHNDQNLWDVLDHGRGRLTMSMSIPCVYSLQSKDVSSFIDCCNRRLGYRADERQLSKVTYQALCNGCIDGQKPRGSRAQ